MNTSSDYTGEYIDGYPPWEHMLDRYDPQFHDKRGNTITEEEFLANRAARILYAKNHIKSLKKHYRIRQLVEKKKKAISMLLEALNNRVIPHVKDKIAKKGIARKSLVVKKSWNMHNSMELIEENNARFSQFESTQLYLTLHILMLNEKKAQKKQKTNINTIIVLIKAELDNRKLPYSTIEIINNGYKDMPEHLRLEIAKGFKN
jgi:hypothetical protein